MEKCKPLLDIAAPNFTSVVNKMIDTCGKSEKVKAVLRNKLLLRDKAVRRKSYKFGAVVDDMMNDKLRAEKAKEQNDKLLRMAGKETKVSGNEKLAWIAGKGSTDQVAVK